MTLTIGLVISGVAITVLGVWALCRAASQADQQLDRLSLLRRLERHRGWERR